MNRLSTRIRPVPFYPVLFLFAWMISVFTDSTASWHILARPLIVGAIVVVVVQLAVSGATRNRHLSAAFVVLVGLNLLGMAQIALAIVLILSVVIALYAARRRDLAALPWRATTRLMNTISLITLTLAIANSVQTGALTPLGGQSSGPRGVAAPSLPDIYLVLLDAYPRSDTLAHDFSYDNEPFLDQMRSLGFDVATDSHSNYNTTVLTVPSMFNMAQVTDLPGVTSSDSLRSEYRALSRAIDHARALDAIRAAGYETVSIPSGFSSVAVYSADRVIDGGQLTDFEYSVLQQGALPHIWPDVVGPWLIGQHRDRVMTTFDTLGELAAERTDHPRFVFAHVLSPHAPIAFGPKGEPRDGWPCFPEVCGIYDGGQRFGDDALEPIRDQVVFLNTVIARTAEQIQTNSQRAPVIVFFSDHGSRYDYADPDETLRSFLIASTPAHPNLFPDDTTPVNIIPRILNAYAGSGIPLASEESFWADLRKNENGGPPFELVPWVVRAP